MYRVKLNVALTLSINVYWIGFYDTFLYHPRHLHRWLHLKPDSSVRKGNEKSFRLSGRPDADFQSVWMGAIDLPKSAIDFAVVCAMFSGSEGFRYVDQINSITKVEQFEGKLILLHQYFYSETSDHIPNARNHGRRNDIERNHITEGKSCRLREGRQKTRRQDDECLNQ